MGKAFGVGLAVLLPFALLLAGDASASERGLVGHWKLQGDCKDHSGNNHHGRNHRVNLATGEFNCRDSYVEVAHAPALRFGTGEFTFAAWVWTRKEMDDVIRDVTSKDGAARGEGLAP